MLVELGSSLQLWEGLRPLYFGCLSAQGKLCRDGRVPLVAEVWERGGQVFAAFSRILAIVHHTSGTGPQWDGDREGEQGCSPGLEQSIPVAPGKGSCGHGWPSLVPRGEVPVPCMAPQELSGMLLALAAGLVPAPPCLPPC